MEGVEQNACAKVHHMTVDCLIGQPMMYCNLDLGQVPMNPAILELNETIHREEKNK
jgi:hypothetical protein